MSISINRVIIFETIFLITFPPNHLEISSIINITKETKVVHKSMLNAPNAVGKTSTRSINHRPG